MRHRNRRELPRTQLKAKFAECFTGEVRRIPEKGKFREFVFHDVREIDSYPPSPRRTSSPTALLSAAATVRQAHVTVDRDIPELNYALLSMPSGARRKRHP